MPSSTALSCKPIEIPARPVDGIMAVSLRGQVANDEGPGGGVIFWFAWLSEFGVVVSKKHFPEKPKKLEGGLNLHHSSLQPREAPNRVPEL